MWVVAEDGMTVNLDLVTQVWLDGDVLYATLAQNGKTLPLRRTRAADAHQSVLHGLTTGEAVVDLRKKTVPK